MPRIVGAERNRDAHCSALNCPFGCPPGRIHAWTSGGQTTTPLAPMRCAEAEQPNFEILLSAFTVFSIPASK
jgi:hypothetical protein